MRIVTTWLGLLRHSGRRPVPTSCWNCCCRAAALLALLLFLCQRKRPDIARGTQRAVLAVTRMLAGIFEQRILVPVPTSAPPSASETS